MKTFIQNCTYVFVAMIVSVNAKAITVFPLSDSGGVSHVLENAIPSGAQSVRLQTRCYGTNNRSTSNPVSPASTMYIGIYVPGENDSISKNLIL